MYRSAASTCGCNVLLYRALSDRGVNKNKEVRRYETVLCARSRLEMNSKTLKMELWSWYTLAWRRTQFSESDKYHIIWDALKNVSKEWNIIILIILWSSIRSRQLLLLFLWRIFFAHRRKLFLFFTRNVFLLLRYIFHAERVVVTEIISDPYKSVRSFHPLQKYMQNSCDQGNLAMTFYLRCNIIYTNRIISASTTTCFFSSSILLKNITSGMENSRRGSMSNVQIPELVTRSISRWAIAMFNYIRIQ